MLLDGYPLGRSPSAVAGSSYSRNQATLWHDLSLQESDTGVLLDWSGNGHHGYFGGVKRAFIGDVRDGGGRALHLPGIAGNYASVPDEAALDITGDIEFIVKARLDDWTPTAASQLVTKWITGGLSYLLYIEASGEITLTVRVAGANVAGSSTVAPGFIDGSANWIKSTRNASTGEFKHYKSSDYDPDTGAGTWTQIGATVTAATGSIETTSTEVGIGAHSNGATADTAGKVYRAIIKDGIDGTTVLDADFSAQPQGVPSFVCSTGQTVTINQSGSSTAEPTELFHGGETHLWTPGTNSNYASLPNFTLPTDQEWWVWLDATDWTPGTAKYLLAMDDGVQRSIYFRINSADHLEVVWQDAGSKIESPGAPVGVADGEGQWVGFTFDVDDGAGNYALQFYTGGNGEEPVPVALGSVQTGAATTSIASSTAAFTIGAYGDGTNGVGGKYRKVRVLDGIGGDPLVDIDFTDTSAYNATQTELIAVTGQTVTINRSSSGLKSVVVDRNKMVGDGVDDYVEIEDHDDLDFGTTASMTVAFAYRAFSLPTDGRRFINKRSGTSGWEMHGDVSAGNNFKGFWGDGTNFVSPESTDAMAEDEGVTIVQRVNRDSEELSQFANGVLVRTAQDTSTVTGSVSNASVVRLLSASSGTSFAPIELTATALFRRALTDAQIKRLTTEMG